MLNKSLKKNLGATEISNDYLGRANISLTSDFSESKCKND